MDVAPVIVLGMVGGALALMYYAGAFDKPAGGLPVGGLPGGGLDPVGNPALDPAMVFDLLGQPSIAGASAYTGSDLVPLDFGGDMTSVTMTAAEQAAQLSELDVLARTLWGEARGEGTAGMVAVASVIMNRVRNNRYPSTVKAVCLQPYQFSMWLPGDPNGQKALSVGAGDPAYMQALDIAQRALNGALADTTGGATLYYAPAGMAGRLPNWNFGVLAQTVSIGGQLFYREVA